MTRAYAGRSEYEELLNIRVKEKSNSFSVLAEMARDLIASCTAGYGVGYGGAAAPSDEYRQRGEALKSQRPTTLQYEEGRSRRGRHGVCGVNVCFGIWYPSLSDTCI